MQVEARINQDQANPNKSGLFRNSLQARRFKSVEEVLTAALSQLPRKHRSNATAVARMVAFSSQHSVKLPAGESVENLVREGPRY